MSKTGLHEFDEALHTANVWLKDLMEVLGWTEPTQAHQALKIVMHEVRDRLPVPLAANFSSQMPLVTRLGAPDGPVAGGLSRASCNRVQELSGRQGRRGRRRRV